VSGIFIFSVFKFGLHGLAFFTFFFVKLNAYSYVVCDIFSYIYSYLEIGYLQL